MSLLDSLNFLGKYAGVKTEHAMFDIAKIVNSKDPIGGIQAQMKIQEDIVSECRAAKVEAERALAKDEQETFEAKEKADVLLSKLNRIKELVGGDEVTETSRKKLMKEATDLRAKYDAAKKFHERELGQDESKRRILNHANKAYETAQKQTALLEDALETVKSRMDEAEGLKSEKEMELMAAEMAGSLTDPMDSVNVALAAINEVADEYEAEAREIELKIQEAQSESESATSELDRLEAKNNKGDEDPFAGL